MASSDEKAFRDAINDVLMQREKVAHLQEGIKDAVKAIAVRFGKKPSRVNKVISMVESERKKGGTLMEQHGVLDDVETVVL